MHACVQWGAATAFPMTQKQKMLSGRLFTPNDDELIREHSRAVALCEKLNRIRTSEYKERQAVLKELLPHSDETTWINLPFRCDYGYNIHIGKHLLANYDLCILDLAPVTLGDHVFIGPRCTITTVAHPMSYEKRNTGLAYALPVTIGDNVWLGTEVKVGAGVTIGSNVVIGMGSVVIDDIPDNSFAAGCPARVIRSITEDDKIGR